MIKGIYQKSTTNTIFNGAILEAVKNKIKMSLSSLLLNIVLEILVSAVK